MGVWHDVPPARGSPPLPLRPPPLRQPRVSILPEPLRIAQFRLFFLACVIVAGLYGGLTVSRRILLVQALPAALALVAVLLAS